MADYLFGVDWKQKYLSKEDKQRLDAQKVVDETKQQQDALIIERAKRRSLSDSLKQGLSEVGGYFKDTASLIGSDISHAREGKFRSPQFSDQNTNEDAYGSPLNLLGGNILPDRVIPKGIPGLSSILRAANTPSVAASLPLGGGIPAIGRNVLGLSGSVIASDVAKPLTEKLGKFETPVDLAIQALGGGIGLKGGSALRKVSRLKEEVTDPIVRETMGLPPLNESAGMTPLDTNGRPVDPSLSFATDPVLNSPLMKSINKAGVDRIHRIADNMGIKWDNDSKFMKFTKAVTGKEHLDDLSAKELVAVEDALTGKPFESSPAPLTDFEQPDHPLTTNASDIKTALKEARRQELPDIGGGAASATPEQTKLEFGKMIHEMKTKQSGLDPVTVTEDVDNVMKQVNSLGFLESGFIQGLTSIFAEPKVAARSIKVALDSLGNKNYATDYFHNLTNRALAIGAPTPAELVNINKNLIQEAKRLGIKKPGMHWATDASYGIENPGGIAHKLGQLEPFKTSNVLYSMHGNAVRFENFYSLWQQANEGIPVVSGPIGSILKGVAGGSKLAPKFDMNNSENILRLMKASDRLSGFADKNFGKELGPVLYAGRFLQSQVEQVIKAATDGTIEGAVARKHLLSLLTYGTIATVVANEIRGEDTEFNPLKDGHVNSNFLRVKNVQGQDISLFGWTDSLAKVALGLGLGAEQVATGDTIGGLQTALQAPRSKLSPLATTAVDILKGENSIGQEVTPKSLLKSRAPFVTQTLMNEQDKTPVGIGAQALGLKSSALSPTEQLDRTLSDAGIKTSDPEYAIKKKQYLFDHPEALPESQQKDFQHIQDVTKQLDTRSKLNDQEAQQGDITLEKFRDNRKVINLERRVRISELTRDLPKNPRNDQEGWLKSYSELYSKPGVSDPVSGGINSEKFDSELAGWLNKNGQQAYDYVTKYFQTGKGQVETQYLKDLKELDKLGYFSMDRYKGLKSGLTDDEINKYHDMVSAERSSDPRLQREEFSRTALRVLLNEGLTHDQILDVVRSGSKRFSNPEYVKFRAEHNQLLQWFNPNATWDTYQNAKAGVLRK